MDRQKPLDDGDFNCRTCGVMLFNSNKKIDSKTDWTNFYDAADMENIDLEDDESSDLHSTEVRCGNCGSNIGTLYDDGPKDKTGLRYSIRSESLKFKPNEKNAFGFREK